MKNKKSSIEEMITLRDDLLINLSQQKLAQKCGSMLDCERATAKIYEIYGELLKINKEITDAIAARKLLLRAIAIQIAAGAAGVVAGISIYHHYLR